MKNFLTTFDVAHICGVAHTTVIRWIGEGKLKAYETPGRHRRIPRTAMLTFMKRFKIPIPSSISMGNRPSVLVIDDEPGILSMIRKAFSTLANDIELHTTSNGVEALVMIGKNPPDLIILDVVMPEMDGIQVCKTLKAVTETSNIRIIAITGKQLSIEQEDFLKQNMDYVIRKPLSPIALVNKVRELLELPSAVYVRR